MPEMRGGSDSERDGMKEEDNDAEGDFIFELQK
jgi:hypothetical protein